MFTQDWCGLFMIISMILQINCEILVCNDFYLWEAIYTFEYFHILVSINGYIIKVIMINNFGCNIVNGYPHIPLTIHLCIEVFSK